MPQTASDTATDGPRWWWHAAAAYSGGIGTVSFSLNFEGPRVSPAVWDAVEVMIRKRYGQEAALIAMTPLTQQPPE
jgi:hypothetical protein